MEKRLIIVSNRLPFNLVRKEGKLTMKQSDGGLVSALKSYFECNGTDRSFTSTLWIGSAEFAEKDWSKFNKKGIEGLGYEVEPIFFEKKLYSQYYNGFCNSTIWPLFHYFPSFVEFDNLTYHAYEEVNRIFAERIGNILQPNDVLWIHDYQLMLVPGQVRSKVAEATIGFFLHIPFPSFEVFRLLHRPWKERIINSLTSCDLIGFHTHEYVQYFLKTVQMIKGYDHQFRTILLPNRLVKAEMFPLGIDFEKFNHAIEKSEVSTLRDSIIANFSGKKIIFSVDRLDYTKGVTHRLSGFERFLELYPEWRERVVFILVVVPSRQIVSKYNERKKLIEEEIGRINGRFSSLQWQPIIYRYNHLSFSELCAMYNSADVALVTPLRDGMNLVAKEYVASRKGPGVLILSELAGAASELSEAIMVNPMDKDEVGHAIFNSLIMPTAIQKGKLDTMQQRLRDYTVVDWMNDFIKQLDDIRSRQISQQARHLNETSIKRISNHFLKSKRRLLLLDYDGTLVPYSKFPSNAIPDKTLLHLLRLLSDDSRTDITIISGRDSASLESWFGDLPINLVSEHGAGVRLKKQSWKYYLDTNQSWKSVVRPMLEKFTRQSPGSFVEDKKFTLVWHYRNVPHDLGFVRSRELLNNLHHLVRNSPLHVLDGNKVIEVRVAGIDKGTITRKLLRENHYEFVMAIGDDKTDEDMFKILDDAAYTIKIGSGQTSAQYHLTDQFEVLRLLSEMIDETELVNLGV